MLFKNLMIKSKVFLCLFGVSNFMFSQELKFDFNSDTIEDNLTYKCYKAYEYKEYVEPTCELVLKLGSTGKVYKFNLNYVYYPIISDCGTGCISMYDSSKDSEYTQEYQYMKKYDDWILVKDVAFLKYENREEINNLPMEYKLGISGRKYCIKKNKKK